MRTIASLLGMALCMISAAVADSSAECIVFLSPCHEYKLAAAVFDGTVEASEPARFDFQTRMFVAPPVIGGRRVTRARVKVNRAWKGIVESTSIKSSATPSCPMDMSNCR